MQNVICLYQVCVLLLWIRIFFGAFQVLKWNFSTPRPEFIEQLRLQMEPTFNKTLLDQMLHIDFKFHIKALDTLSKVCASLKFRAVFSNFSANFRDYFDSLHFSVASKEQQ
jgi:hypothetical protein